MSTHSFPDGMTPETMMDVTAWLKEMQAMAASPLMVHPMAVSAAATVLGVAAAGQVLGTMIGSMQGALDASRRMAMPSAEALFGDAAAWSPVRGETESRPRPVARLKPVGAPKPASAPGKAEAAAAAPAPEAGVSGPVSDLKAAADTAASAVLESEVKPSAATEPEARAEIAPEDFRRPPEMARPETPDDLKQISGIGPKLEQVLNGLGIWTFGQIVAWTPPEVAWLDDYLQFKGRIERDNWQTQAKTLANAGK